MDRPASKRSVTAGGRFPNPRSAPRYLVTALADVFEPTSRKHVTGWTSTVGDAGCHIRAGDSFAIGTIVQLRIEQEGRAFETWARVASATPQEGMGLAFFDTAQSQRDLLKTWMNRARAIGES
jgi:hypothetical protein